MKEEEVSKLVFLLDAFSTRMYESKDSAVNKMLDETKKALNVGPYILYNSSEVSQDEMLEAASLSELLGKVSDVP